jgi:hypothetical protein
MKIKKVGYKDKYKLLKFNLVSSKIIKKSHVDMVENEKSTIDEVESRLRKALRLIYLYHINSKKILFVGNPLSINNEITKLLKKTKHIFIPKSAWISGLITNQKSSFNLFFKKESKINNTLYQKLLLLKKKSDLVVIMDEKTESQSLDESYNERLPIITLNSDLNPFNFKSSYKIPGNFICAKNKLENNFFYLILLAALKKAEVFKKRFPILVYKLKPGDLNYFKRRKFRVAEKRRREHKEWLRRQAIKERNRRHRKFMAYVAHKKTESNRKISLAQKTKELQKLLKKVGKAEARAVRREFYSYTLDSRVISTNNPKIKRIYISPKTIEAFTDPERKKLNSEHEIRKVYRDPELKKIFKNPELKKKALAIPEIKNVTVNPEIKKLLYQIKELTYRDIFWGRKKW